MSEKKHGGARAGAGRKSLYGEPTKPMRIPVSQLEAVLDFVKAKIARAASTPLGFSLPVEESAERFELPVFSSAVRAGFPSPADDHVEYRLDLNDLVPHKEATYYAWVEGDSMIDLHILDGDLIMVDKAVSAETGDIVVAEVEGNFTVKRLGKQDGAPCLLPANPDYPVIELSADVGATIWGVVVRVIHDPRQGKRRRLR
jgi:DNA polymerase V